MPTITLFPVAATVAGSPRTSPEINYRGGSDRSVLLQLVCPTWATADPDQVVLMEVQQSFAGEQGWNTFCRLETPTRKTGRTGGLPSTNCLSSDDRGVRKVRAVLSVSTGTLDIGVSATV